jgi:SAF domain
MTIDGAAPPASPGRFGAATPGMRPAPTPLDDLLATPDPPRRRRWSRGRVLLVVALVFVAAGGYVAGHYTWPRPAPPRPAELVVTATALPAGQRLSPADFRTVRLEPGVRRPPGALTPAQAARLAGMVTARAIPAGTFLARSLITSGGALPDSSRALVGLALKPGQLPVGGLAPGQQVLVVLLRTSQAGGTVHAAPLVTTTVWDMRGPDSSGDVVASVVVPAHLAALVSAYAAQGNVALVATAGRPSSPAPRRTAGRPSSPTPHARPSSSASKKSGR